MKKLLLLLLILGFYSIKSPAQDDQMKIWMAYMTPGKEHQDLAKMNGEWTFVNKFWMDPSGPPQTTEGIASCEMLLGGRYQQMKVSGKMMGMDFNGISTVGFDNAKKIWVSSWIDNFGTGMMYSEGTYDEASKSIIFRGKMFDPISAKDIDQKQTFKIVDDKTCVMEMFSVVDGKDIKNMIITYTKK